jgi:hypothetical protein
VLSGGNLEGDPSGDKRGAEAGDQRSDNGNDDSQRRVDHLAAVTPRSYAVALAVGLRAIRN